MKISNLYDDLSVTNVQEKAAPVGDLLRVAVTKTSAQGKAAQSTAPNLMSFSTDENSIWFNGKKYGVYVLKEFNDISNNPSSQGIQSFLGDFTYDKWEEARNVGSLVFVTVTGALCPAAINVDTAPSGSDILVNIFVNFDDLQLHISVQYSASTGYSAKILLYSSINSSDIVNSLDKDLPDKPLSASMGKKLNDEKLPKSFVVNNLTTTDTTKALSAVQGKVLNDKISSLNTKLSSNIIVIDTNRLPEGITTEDQIINEALGVSGTELYNAFKSGATIVDSGDNIIYPSLVGPDHMIFNVLYLLDEPTVYTKTVELKFSSTGQYSSCTVTLREYPIPEVENSLTSNNTANALSAAQGKVLNDKISALGSVYRIKGSKTNISEVLALTDAKVGDAWSVANAFTFGGKPYPANTNVVCLVATSTSDHDEGNWDPIGGTVDLSPYAKKTEVEESDNEIWEQFSVMVSKDEIVNNLTSTNTDKPLSAAMGKQLNDGKISRSEIVNNLITNDSSKPLSAAQGKKLQDEKLSKTDASNTYLTKTSAESTYAKKADGISHYSIGELTALSSNPTQEQLKTALGAPSALRSAIDSGKLILVTGSANVQSQKSATCIIDSGNVIVKYLHPGNNCWTVIAKCVPASSGDNWDNAQFSVRIVKPLDSAGIIIE